MKENRTLRCPVSSEKKTVHRDALSVVKENRTTVCPVVKQRHYARMLQAQKKKFPTHIEVLATKA